MKLKEVIWFTMTSGKTTLGRRIENRRNMDSKEKKKREQIRGLY